VRFAGIPHKGRALAISRKFYKAALALSFILLISNGFYPAFAGPPLATDDTGIVPLGDWQFIVSAQGESRPATDSGALPAIEVTYGFFEDMNLTAVVPRQYIEDRGESSKTGLGNAEVNYKWLFYDNDRDSDEGVTMAFSPVYSFPLTKTSRVRGLAEDVKVLALPVIGYLVKGRWEFAAQASYDVASGDGSVDGLGYGVFAVYNTTDSVQLMAEIYGAELSGDGFVDSGLSYDEGFMNWRLGALWEVGSGFSLLGAYGGAIESDLPRDQKLDYEFFLGLQYDTE
jgi:hypothetical protein